jgi:hypothetical protein
VGGLYSPTPIEKKVVQYRSSAKILNLILQLPVKAEGEGEPEIRQEG